MSSLGDFAPSTIVYGKFTTYRPSTGAPFTLAGTPALSVYKDNSTTQSTTGVTLTVDFDSVTGLHHFAIDTSADGTFYSSGSSFDIVITAGTVDSISAVGTVVGRFTIAKTACLKPTVAGRTLDVSAGGEAGIDWANVGSPTTTLGLTGTTISTAQAVASVSGNVGGSVGSVASGGITSASFASAAITATAIATDALGAAELASDSVAEIADAVWDELLSGHAGAGSAGLALSTASSGGVDPSVLADAVWDEALSGHATAGSAGATLSGASTLTQANIRTAVGLASANLDTQLAAIDDFLDTEIAAIKAKTDNLPAAPAATGDIPTAAANAAALLDLTDGVETGYTVRQALRLTLAALVGKLSGAGTTTITIRNVIDAKSRIIATVDSDGNRSALTLDAT